MTEQEFVTAIEAIGGSDVEVRTVVFDFGSKLGIASQFKLGGKKWRNAVRLPPDATTDDAFPVLLGWAKELVAA